MKRSVPMVLVLLTAAILLWGCGGGGSSDSGSTTGTVSAPTFSPAPGTYASAQSVTLSTSTAGASIRYTTDGSTPTSTTGTPYAGAIAVSATTTIKAIAYMSGLVDSGVTSGTYTITIAIAGTITGTVSDTSKGTTVPAATVTVDGASVATAANGTYTLANVSPGSGKVVTIAKADYVFGSKIVMVTAGGSTRADVSLLPVAYTTTFDPATAQILAPPGSTAQVDLGANALKTGSGAAPTGNVTANITPVDPSSNPQIMPGNYSTAAGDLIESFGALAVTFTDSTGAALNLGAGQSATIRIPVAAGAVSPPVTMPAYFYNASTGKWVEEGTLMRGGVAPDQYYTGMVTHFSYWNADQPYSTTCITGRVVDASDVPVTGARVEAQGRDYIGTSEAYTAADGTFTIQVKSNSTVIVIASDSNSLSQSEVVSTGPAGAICIALATDLKLGATSLGLGSARIKMTWGLNPNDLDSHLTGPDPSVSSTARFHIYFVNQGTFALPPFARLDVDDIDSFGPEVITVSKFNTGTYRYSVHHYGGSDTIFSSPARVELTLNGATQIFTPPNPGVVPIGVDTVWTVFEIAVTSDGQFTVTPINTYTLNVISDNVP